MHTVALLGIFLLGAVITLLIPFIVASLDARAPTRSESLLVDIADAKRRATRARYKNRLTQATTEYNLLKRRIAETERKADRLRRTLRRKPSEPLARELEDCERRVALDRQAQAQAILTLDGLRREIRQEEEHIQREFEEARRSLAEIAKRYPTQRITFAAYIDNLVHIFIPRPGEKFTREQHVLRIGLTIYTAIYIAGVIFGLCDSIHHQP